MCTILIEKMALQVYRYANYLTTEEREQFRTLCKLLSKSEEDCILIANPIIEGRELDALLIKRDAIIVLEFKNYSGALTASEFGDWFITEDDAEKVIVKGGFGKKNPYSQVLQNKWCVVNRFKDLNSPLINAYHVAGLVIFKQSIEEKKYDFSQKVRSWFHITDMDHVMEQIENITSSKINFNDELWRELPKYLNVEDYSWDEYEQKAIAQEENTETPAAQPVAVRGEITINDELSIEQAIRATGFHICHKRTEAKREAQCLSYSDMRLSERSLNFLKEREIDTLWKHQIAAITEAKKGSNVCITTSTSSGKTEIFQISAMEILEKSPEAKILAVYPMKALNREQLERWKKTGYSVGKIDGDVSIEVRKEVLKQNRIVVMTPDVMHTFLLGRLNDRQIGKTIEDFIKNISLIVVDELHLYKGVFGSNAAYLFRRLNHVRQLLRKDKSFAQYITASATLPAAVEHSFNITGVKGFVEIGTEQDASPMAEKVFYFIERDEEAVDKGNDLVADLLYAFTTIKDAKTIAFVEGRQRAGELAYFADKESASGIYPYRAGYEKETVDVITQHLNDGNFKGVVSTSALEIGINIDGLNIAIIADMPHDKNSYQQRIGRVGRFGCEKSYVIIVRTDAFPSQLLFDTYNYDIDRVLPCYEPALYLEDENVQIIHACCHVGSHDNSEYDQWKKRRDGGGKFIDGGCFPSSFVKLCQEVLDNQYPKSYVVITKGITNPHWGFTLRHFDIQYDVVPVRDERKHIPKEQISREMLATEGYIGAARNTMDGNEKIKERVTYIDIKEKKIYVKREYNQFLSTSAYHRKILFPNFKKEFRKATLYYGDAKIYNLLATEHHTIYGYYEKKNGRKVYQKYDRVFRLPVLFLTATVIFHPSFNKAGVKVSDIAKILFETFLQKNAFDRNDINYLGSRLFSSNDVHRRDEKFVALYDANILNITGRLANDDLLKDLFAYLAAHQQVIARTICPDINEATLEAISDLCQSVMGNKVDIAYQEVGKERFFEGFTEVLYLEEDENDPEAATEEKIAEFMGYGNDGTVCNIRVGDRCLKNIPIDRIKATENTTFE